MTADSKRLTNSKIKIGDSDFFCEQTLRIGGMLFLEEMLGKGFEEVSDDVQKAMGGDVTVTKVVQTMSPFILALMHQCHPDSTVEELQEVINRLRLEEFTELFSKLKLFKDETEKNSQGPTAKTKRRRQPVTGSKSRGRTSSSA